MRRFSNPPFRRQGGFAILYVVIATVALLGVVAAVTAGSRTSVTNPTDQVRAIASGVIQEGNNMALVYQAAEAKKSSMLPTFITYGSCTAASCQTTPVVAANDLLNTANASLSLQTPPPAAFVSTATKKYWIYKSTASGATPTVAGAGALNVPGVGSSAADFAFVLTELDQGVCQQINTLLYGSTSTIPTLTSAAIGNFQGAATTPPLIASGQGSTDSTSVDLTSSKAALTAAGFGSTPMQGCVLTSDAPAAARYVYYVVAEPQ